MLVLIAEAVLVKCASSLLLQLLFFCVLACLRCAFACVDLPTMLKRVLGATIAVTATAAVAGGPLMNALAESSLTMPAHSWSTIAECRRTKQAQPFRDEVCLYVCVCVYVCLCVCVSVCVCVCV